MSNKRKAGRQTLSALDARLNERLAGVGAIKLPDGVYNAIAADVVHACGHLIKRRVSAPYVSRLTARILAAQAANLPEGSKGEDESSPLASQQSDFRQKVPICVACPHSDHPDNQPDTTSNGATELPTGERRTQTKTTRVNLGRPRLPGGLASTLAALKPRLRSQAVAAILMAHTNGIDLGKLITATEQLRRAGTLINQSLRLSAGRDVDKHALRRAVEIVNSLRA